MASPSIWIPGEAKRRTPPLAPMRKFGKPHGSHIDDVVTTKQAVILCSDCNHRFDAKRSNYYKDTRFSPVVGNCDACRVYTDTAQLYIHEQYLTDSGGRSKAGRTWIPK